MSLGERPIGAARGRSLKEWTDEELVAEYRHVKDELAHGALRLPDGDDTPAVSLEEEMRRRGLEPDREDVIPDASSTVQGEHSPPSRGTAPDADEQSPG